MTNYFKKSKWFQEYCNGIRKSLKASKECRIQTCGACPHQRDKHGMNCIDCCPINRALGA
jgi:hypothetical protein